MHDVHPSVIVKELEEYNKKQCKLFNTIQYLTTKNNTFFKILYCLEGIRTDSIGWKIAVIEHILESSDKCQITICFQLINW